MLKTENEMKIIKDMLRARIKQIDEQIISNTLGMEKYWNRNSCYFAIANLNCGILNVEKSILKDILGE